VSLNDARCESFSHNLARFGYGLRQFRSGWRRSRKPSVQPTRYRTGCNSHRCTTSWLRVPPTSPAVRGRSCPAGAHPFRALLSAARRFSITIATPASVQPSAALPAPHLDAMAVSSGISRPTGLALSRYSTITRESYSWYRHRAPARNLAERIEFRDVRGGFTGLSLTKSYSMRFSASTMRTLRLYGLAGVAINFIALRFSGVFDPTNYIIRTRVPHAGAGSIPSGKCLTHRRNGSRLRDLYIEMR